MWIMVFLIQIYIVLIVASSLSDVSVLGGPSSVKIESYPDPTDRKTDEVISVIYKFIIIYP